MNPLTSPFLICYLNSGVDFTAASTALKSLLSYKLLSLIMFYVLVLRFSSSSFYLVLLILRSYSSINSSVVFLVSLGWSF